MPAYHLSHLAKKDLQNIWDYTTQKWSESQAEQYILQLKSALSQICLQPNLARHYQTKKGIDYLRFQINSHFIFFRIENEMLYITRILNQRMNIEEHL
jgi:toxin ParE1/3/4